MVECVSGPMERSGNDVGCEMVEMWSDASGSWGCGALWAHQWCQIAWTKWPSFAEASIELLPIIVVAAL